MGCVNKSDPDFKRILEVVRNPLLAELKYKEDYPTIDDGVTDEIYLYLADQIRKNFGVRIPINNPDMFSVISTRDPINQIEVDEKKLEC